MTATWSSTAIGSRSPWLSVLTRRSPRASVRWVSGSRSEPNCAKASRSRNCESSIFRRPATFFIGADLRVAAHARHRDADVDGRAHARVEEVRLEEDLAVGDRDHVRRDVGRDVAGLGLDDRQRRHRPAAEAVVELDRALEQAGVQVEDVARVGLAPRRAAQQQRHLAVGVRVLGEVVVDHQRVLAVVEEVLGHRAAGVGRHELDRGGLVGGRGDDDRRVQRAGVVEQLGQAHDRGHALADRHVDRDRLPSPCCS